MSLYLNTLKLKTVSPKGKIAYTKVTCTEAQNLVIKKALEIGLSPADALYEAQSLANGCKVVLKQQGLAYSYLLIAK